MNTTLPSDAEPVSIDTQTLADAMHDNPITSINFAEEKGRSLTHPTPSNPVSQPTARATTRKTDLQRWAVMLAGRHVGFVNASSQAEARRQIAHREAALVLVTTHFRHAVKGGASAWRLFRRRPNRPGGWNALDPRKDTWHLLFEHRARRHALAFGTDSVELAIEQAKQQLTNHFEGHFDQYRHGKQRPSGRRSYSTLAEVFTVRHRLAIDARTTKAVDNYMWGTRYVMARIFQLASLEAADTLSCDVLNKANGRQYFVRAREEARRLPTQAEQNRFSRTCNQAFNFCCALFSERAVESMTEDLKLTLPETIPQFRARAKLDRLDGGNASEFTRPNDETITRTIAAWEALGNNL
jgi:hypothetical protein